MKYYDYHIHSQHSFDGWLTIDKICRKAAAINMAGITFTEHVEFTGLYNEDLQPDFAQYAKDIALAKKNYPDLKIGIGIELGLKMASSAKAEKISQVLEWDFIIGSAHYMDGCTLHTGEFSEGKSKEESWHQYFIGLRKLVEEVNCFDVLGHLDLLRRDTTYDDRSLLWQDYQEEIDAMLLTLISMGKGIEVNTGAWRYGLEEPHPVSSIISRYRELGGEIITCGSDAHLEKSLCQGIPEAYEYIKKAGFKYITLFEKRKLRQMPL
ncbi:MAG: histidinol-phosphatase HisJ family protein [Bacillota bacterium]|jgi:histidinol-phosphatase (PHP family)